MRPGPTFKIVINKKTESSAFELFLIKITFGSTLGQLTRFSLND